MVISMAIAAPLNESEVKQIIPADVLAKLTSIQKQDSLSGMEKQQQINSIVMGLPQSTLNKLPLPKAFQVLPQAAQKQAREIIFNKTMSQSEKNVALDKFVAALPSAQAKLMTEDATYSKQLLCWCCWICTRWGCIFCP
uniref:Uncharacterized protein n=1 Tax=Acrobeloides nanus TaxID=290746 RepID=A0A914ECF0_9BILA